MYAHYHDYNIKSILEKRSNSLLRVVGIPHEIRSVIFKEVTGMGPAIRRLDFAADVGVLDEIPLTLILECQTIFPTDDDLDRFFEYLVFFKKLTKGDVEVYILCMDEIDRNHIKYRINKDSYFIFNLVSLKNLKAEEIFKTN